MEGARLGFRHQADGIEIDGGDDSGLRALVADVPHQGAGVDPLDADDAILLQIGIEAHASNASWRGNRSLP